MQHTPPNVLVLFTDQQRYDSLGCNGNPAARTPHLDALAAGGARLGNHIVPNPVCMPSRASFFTGRFPGAHGLWTNGVPLPKTERTLPELLKQRGYDTASFGKLHLTPTEVFGAPDRLESHGLWATGAMDDWHGPYYGFDHVELSIGHGEEALQHGHYANDMRARFPGLYEKLAEQRAEHHRKRDRLRDVYVSEMPVEAHHSTWVADRTIAYLRDARRAQRPFFAFASFPDPHHPFTPPEPYASMFDPDGLPAAHRSPDGNAGKPAHYRSGGGTRLQPGDEPVLRELTAYTYGQVSLVDHSVGRILTALDDLGMTDDTVVVFTADHGELLGDHGLLRKGPYPCRSLLRVPCLLRAPGTVAPGTTVGGATGHTDLVPTLLELTGSPVPARVQGRSLLPGLTGSGDLPDEGLSMGWDKGSGRHNHQSLFTERWRVTVFPNMDDGELYDLEADPHELTNLFHDPAHRAVRQDLLVRLLAAWGRGDARNHDELVSTW